MAFDAQSITRVGSVPYSSGEVKSKYMYATPDTVANILASGYFNNFTKTLRKGDLIEASCVNGGTPTCTLCVVTSASGAATVTTAAASFS